MVRDEGNVETAVAEATALRDERARFLPEIHDTCELIAARVAEATTRGAMPLVLGGDHSVALGTLGGMADQSTAMQCNCQTGSGDGGFSVSLWI